MRFEQSNNEALMENVYKLLIQANKTLMEMQVQINVLITAFCNFTCILHDAAFLLLQTVSEAGPASGSLRIPSQRNGGP